MRELRQLARVAPDAVCVAVGDGGNEVGMGKVVCCPGVSELSPGGDRACLAVNGCVRGCDAVVLGTVSNWAGTAIEAACHLLWPVDVDYVARMRGRPRAFRKELVAGASGDLEEELLDAIMAQPTGAVDGSQHDREKSVDGLSYEPCHRELYDYLWRLAGVSEAKRRKRG